jgi:hypothetical protein
LHARRPTTTRPEDTFRVIKDFTDDDPAHVDVEISCFTGLPLIQNQEIWEGRDVEFIVESFDPGELDCDISEVIPEGYSPTTKLRRRKPELRWSP